MRVKFIVTVTIQPNERQSKQKFLKEDGKDMIPYLKDKLLASVQAGETWQYNAIVTRATVKKVP